VTSTDSWRRFDLAQFAKDRVHPRRRESKVLGQGASLRRRDRPLQVCDPLRGDAVLAKCTKGLDQEPAQASRRRHVPRRRPAQLNRGASDPRRPRGAVGEEDHLRRHLLAEPKQVGRIRTARLQAQTVTAREGGGDCVCRWRAVTEDAMALREVVDAASQSADRAPRHQAVQGNIDGAPGPKFKEFVGNEHGASAAPSERGEDPGIDRA